MFYELCEWFMLLHRPPKQEVKMKKSEMFGIWLEVDNRSAEDKLHQNASKTPTMSSVLGLGQEVPEAVMDTDHHEKMEVPKDQLRINPNFYKWGTINCCSSPSIH